MTAPHATRWKAQAINGQVRQTRVQPSHPLHVHYFSVLFSCFAAGFIHANQCNNVFGCLEEQPFERCTCYRDCGYDGEPVCGSDGQLYQNLCQMEVYACRNGTRIKQVPLSLCPHGKFGWRGTQLHQIPTILTDEYVSTIYTNQTLYLDLWD